MEHTKGKLTAQGTDLIHNQLNVRFAQTFGVEGNPAKEANAERLAKCWNCHDELLEAAIELVNGWDHPDNVGEMWIPDFCSKGVDMLKQAIKKATE